MAESLVNMYTPDYVSPPGETLAELLEERGLTQAVLAERMGRPKKTINEIVQGKAAITAETALQLDRVLDVPAGFWLRREQQYREFLARQQEEEQLAQHIDWLHSLPMQQMVQLGWITFYPEPIAQLREVLRFFGIASPAQRHILTAALRRSTAFQSDDEALRAWLRQGERQAQTIDCQPYDERGFRALLIEVRGLTRASFDSVRLELPRLCARVGVAVTIVTDLPQTRVCGATRWFTSSKALIQLGLRYKTDDQFWFTFFHEAGHILLHGKRAAFLDEESYADDPREDEANRFAANMLIPPANLRHLLEQRGRDHFSAGMIVKFAEEIGVAPGIVVGRLQHDALLPKTHLNKLKQRIDISSTREAF